MRTYAYCAKGGHQKEKNNCWVCGDHLGTEGYYTHCARCGGLQPIRENQTTRCYLHHHCRKRRK